MACRGSMVDDYCWLPEEFPEEVFFLSHQQEEKKAPSTMFACGRAPGRGSGEQPPTPSLLPCFPSEFPYDIDSSLSPSAAGTDSDEEDYEELLAAGFAQKMMMAQRSFRLSEAEEAAAAAVWPPSSFAAETQKISAAMRHQQQYFPQSTLSPAGSWTAFGGSPTDPDYLFMASRKRDETALDLLSAAAMEVERMRLKDGAMLRRVLANSDNGRGLLPGPGVHRKNGNVASAGTLNNKTSGAGGGFYGNPQVQVRAAYQLRPVAAPVGGNLGPGQNGPRPASSPYTYPPSTWSLPVPQPQNHHHRTLAGSGLRAGAGARRESSGTGVFLPRRDGNPPPSKKKPACSTVLLPARVVQALNLNLDDIGALPVVSHGAGAGFVVNSEVMRARNRTTQPQQQWNQTHHTASTARSATTKPHHHHHVPGATTTAPNWSQQEIRLPTEWSY